MVKKAKITFEMPANVKVEERPEGLDLLLRCKNKWLGVVQNLGTLGATQVITIDLGDLMDTPHINSKMKLNSIKAGITNTARTMGFKDKIRFAVKGNKLYVWSNLK